MRRVMSVGEGRCQGGAQERMFQPIRLFPFNDASERNVRSFAGGIAGFSPAVGGTLSCDTPSQRSKGLWKPVIPASIMNHPLHLMLAGARDRAPRLMARR